VDFGGREVGCGEAAQSSLVAAFTAAQRVDGERGPSVRNIFGCGEPSELLVGGKDLIVDRGDDLFGEAFLVGF